MYDPVLLARLTDFDGSFSIGRTGSPTRGFSKPWYVSLHFEDRDYIRVEGNSPDEAMTAALDAAAARSPEQRRIERAARLRAELTEIERAA